MRSIITHARRLIERLSGRVQGLRGEALKRAPLDYERERLTRSARVAETACHIEAWLSSPGLQAPQ